MASAKEWAAAVERRITLLEQRIEELEALADESDGWDFEAPDTKEVMLAPEGTTERKVVYMDGETMVIPPPTEAQVVMRALILPQLGLENLKAAPVLELETAYEKGGPLWLLHYDQAYCDSLPFPLREWMVDDIMLTDVALGHEWARHLLKVRTDDQKGFAMGQAEIDAGLTA